MHRYAQAVFASLRQKGVNTPMFANIKKSLSNILHTVADVVGRDKHEIQFDVPRKDADDIKRTTEYAVRWLDCNGPKPTLARRFQNKNTRLRTVKWIDGPGKWYVMFEQNPTKVDEATRELTWPAKLVAQEHYKLWWIMRLVVDRDSKEFCSNCRGTGKVEKVTCPWCKGSRGLLKAVRTSFVVVVEPIVKDDKVVGYNEPVNVTINQLKVKLGMDTTFVPKTDVAPDEVSQEQLVG